MSFRFVEVLALFAVGCQSESPTVKPYDWALPDGMPAPAVPADNPMTDEKVKLGRHLFYDPRLSANEEIACGTCHLQELAFSDGLRVSLGGEGDATPRNSMGLTNVAYRGTYTWANPVLDTLEAQALVPLLGEFPIELGLSGNERKVLERLSALPLYQDLFVAAFDSPEVTLERIAQALASFQRTLLSFDSPYDRFVNGEEGALSPSAERGLALFFSERTECYHCHSGPDFSASFRTEDQVTSPAAFFNNALYNLGDDGSYPAPNVGLVEFTGNNQDNGKFRVPTLRNIELTAPYMHDGSIDTLLGVMQHYRSGGRTIDSGPHAGIGAESPIRDSLIFPLSLSDDEVEDLIAFLEALTDREFTRDPELSSPFGD